MRHVVIAIFPGVQALDVSGPLDVFSEANRFVPDGVGYSTQVASPGGLAVRASNGQQLLVDLALEDGGDFDVALVAGGPAFPQQAVGPSLVTWLRDVASRCPRFGSIESIRHAGGVSRPFAASSNGPTMSSGSGNTMVEFLSAAMTVSVSR